MQVDLWMPNGQRFELERASVIGMKIDHLVPRLPRLLPAAHDQYDRQIRMFGNVGQQFLAQAHVAVIGLGGIGSLVVEYLARLGVGHFTVVDDDVVEASNLSPRIVGASQADVKGRTPKGEIAVRQIHQANPSARVVRLDDDIAKSLCCGPTSEVRLHLLCGGGFMRRLVVNALVHQYLIPCRSAGV